MFSIPNKMQFIRLLNVMAREKIFTRRAFLPEFSTLTLYGCITFCLISLISISQVPRFEKVLYGVFHVYRFFRCLSWVIRLTSLCLCVTMHTFWCSMFSSLVWNDAISMRIAFNRIIENDAELIATVASSM